MTYVVYSPPATEPVTIAEVMAHCRIDADNQEPAPGAITVALGSGAGNVDNGIHRYQCTFVTADGETHGGVISAAVTVADKSVNGKVSLSAIPIGGSLVTSRKIYRTVAGGSVYYLLTTISDNTTTTYTDNTADSGLGAQVPSANTTGDPLLNILIASARQHAETILKRYLITQTIDLYLDCFDEWEIKLPPLQSVSAITYVDNDGATQTIDSTDYLVDAVSVPARITPAYGKVWPVARYQNNAIKIRFIAGYGSASAVPKIIKNWILNRIEEEVNQTAHNEYIDRLLDPERVYY